MPGWSYCCSSRRVYRVGVQGGYTGVWDQGGYREGNTGYPASSLKAEADTAERAPEAPQGLEWVVSAAAPAQACTHPSGPVGLGQPSPPWYMPGLPGQSRLWANKGEI